MGLIIPFILERHKAIQSLEGSCVYMLLYKPEIIVGASLIILSFIMKFLILSYIIGAYHLYWGYKNYLTFAIRN